MYGLGVRNHILVLAFVTPTGTADINWDDGSQDTLKHLVSSARKSGASTKIVLSVGELFLSLFSFKHVNICVFSGGWGGSYWYSHAVSNDTNRKKLASTLYGAVKSYGLDGVHRLFPHLLTYLNEVI